MNMNPTNIIASFVFNDEINLRLIEFCKSFKDIELYLVGGYLRDIFRNVTTCDRDYVITGINAITFAEELANLVNGHLVVLDKQNDIARVVLPDSKDVLDIAACFGNTIHEDLSRRDFTVNAMAFKIHSSEDAKFFDPFNGLQDLNNRFIKPISGQNIIDDPLRILRAFRIAAQLSGTIDSVALNLMQHHASLLKNISAERIQVELNKLFVLKDSIKYLKNMASKGILEIIIPEMKDLHKVPGIGYHHLGLFEHTLEVYNQIEKLVPELDERTQAHFQEYITPSAQRIIALKYSAILHDIAKPKTWLIQDDGKHTFIRHPSEGALISEEIAKRLKLPNVVVNTIKRLVKFHLYPPQLSDKNNVPTKKALHRFFRKIGTDVPELIALAIADRRSTLGPLTTIEKAEEEVASLKKILSEYYVTIDKVSELPKLLNGKNVMEILSLKPSPKVGKILAELQHLQIEGIINTEEDAINWLKESYKN